MKNSRGRLSTFRGPTFLPENIRLWFRLLEISFEEAGISEDISKFVYVFTSLDLKHLEEVENILSNPPSTGKYESLKQALIERLNQTEEERTQQLLAREKMGDSTPSKYLQHVRSLAGSSVSEKMIKSIWWSRLPASLRVSLAGRDDMSLEQLAKLADTIFKQQTLSKVMTFDTKPKSMDNSSMTKVMNNLTLGVTEPIQSRKPKPDATNDQIILPRRRSPQLTIDANRPDREKWCWFHQKFGRNARNCNSPCTYKSGNGQVIQVHTSNLRPNVTNNIFDPLQPLSNPQLNMIYGRYKLPFLNNFVLLNFQK